MKYAIQAKRQQAPVGNGAVQEVIAGRIFYECQKAWVVTNSTFTESAKALAEKAEVTLHDGAILFEEISRRSDIPIPPFDEALYPKIERQYRKIHPNS